MIDRVRERVRRCGRVFRFWFGLFLIPQTIPAAVPTQTVNLGWTPPGGTAATYNVYYGVSSGTYTNIISAGANTNLSVPGLVGGSTYYFAATSVDSSGVESDFSNEASYAVPSPMPLISAMSNQVMTVNAIAPAVFFTVTDPYMNPSSLVVTATSSNPALVPAANILLSGSGSNRVVQAKPLANLSGTTTITILANDNQGDIATNTFLLTVVPNQPPTINPINPMVLPENAGPQTVTLTGLGPGSPTEVQPLTITATSSNPSLIPTPVINYTDPSSTATLSFTPVTGATGSATVTVNVDDGQTQNHITSRRLFVTVELSQTITMSPIGQHHAGAAPFAVTATASSGLPVTFNVVSGHATVNGDMVTETGWGWVTIGASQAGNSSYAPAANVTQSFFIVPPTNAIGAGAAMPDGTFQMPFYGIPGKTYTLEASTDGRHWQNQFSFLCTNTPQNIIDAAAANYAQRFYRLAIVGPYPAVGFPGKSTNGFTLTIAGPISSNYVVQVSTNLANWQTLTNFKSTASPTTILDTAGKSMTRRYYRAYVQ